MPIVIVSGGFDPIHSGHIQMINDASKYGGVVVLLNSDEWLIRKKGKAFMNWDERYSIISNLKNVHSVFDFDDSDGTACDGIRQVYGAFGSSTIYFANGGDRKFNTTPSFEQSLCNDLGIECLWGIGGDYKKNSSSTILTDWQSNTEQRPWGEFSVHKVGDGYKVKSLTVNPRQRLSLQYHEHRAEHWIVLSGKALVTINDTIQEYSVGEMIYIPRLAKHRVACIGDSPCTILEAQIGDICVESDIVRLEDDYTRISI